jgi:hypothetical protein
MEYLQFFKLKNVGKRTKLTQNIQTTIFKCIILGLSYQNSAVAARITRLTLRNYIRRGQKEKSGKYFGLLNESKKLWLMGERINFDKIRDAAIGG